MKENLDDKDKAIIERDNIIRTFHYFLNGLSDDLKNMIERITELLN